MCVTLTVLCLSECLCVGVCVCVSSGISWSFQQDKTSNRSSFISINPYLIQFSRVLLTYRLCIALKHGQSPRVFMAIKDNDSSGLRALMMKL